MEVVAITCPCFLPLIRFPLDHSLCRLYNSAFGTLSDRSSTFKSNSISRKGKPPPTEKKTGTEKSSLYIQSGKMPNILVTGTPGTGKSTLAASLAKATGHQHIDVSKLVKEKELHDGYIAEFDTFDLNDDKLVDFLEDEVLIHTARNCIVDFHTSEIFPERWFDLVVVLRTDNQLLVPRLQARYVCYYIFFCEYLYIFHARKRAGQMFLTSVTSKFVRASSRCIFLF
jgi:energy-coupling factor transporter ATP-binding protein EcfA2